jgi:hypothetical protein
MGEESPEFQRDRHRAFIPVMAKEIVERDLEIIRLKVLVHEKDQDLLKGSMAQDEVERYIQIQENNLHQLYDMTQEEIERYHLEKLYRLPDAGDERDR